MHIIGYILIAAVFFFIGYFARLEKNKLSGLPGHKNPPAPPKKRLSIKSGHLKPGYYGYIPETFANVNKCSNCKVIGLYEDIHTVNPCPICGGAVKRNGAAKWTQLDGQYQWVSAKLGGD